MEPKKSEFSSNIFRQFIEALDKGEQSDRSGANVIKLFTVASYDFSLARAFVPGKPSQPTRLKHTFRCSTFR
jgi:hypothetical protein